MTRHQRRLRGCAIVATLVVSAAVSGAVVALLGWGTVELVRWVS